MRGGKMYKLDVYVVVFLFMLVEWVTRPLLTRPGFSRRWWCSRLVAPRRMKWPPAGTWHWRSWPARGRPRPSSSTSWGTWARRSSPWRRWSSRARGHARSHVAPRPLPPPGSHWWCWARCPSTRLASSLRTGARTRGEEPSSRPRPPIWPWSSPRTRLSGPDSPDAHVAPMCSRILTILK